MHERHRANRAVSRPWIHEDPSITGLDVFACDQVAETRGVGLSMVIGVHLHAEHDLFQVVPAR